MDPFSRIYHHQPDPQQQHQYFHQVQGGQQVFSMANGDPQPSTSSALSRSGTDSQPLLSEAEYAQLAKELGPQFGAASQNNSRYLSMFNPESRF